MRLNILILACIFVGLSACSYAQISPPMDGMGFATCTSGSPYDRFYEFGDDSVEGGTVGNAVGINVLGSFATLDSVGSPSAGDFNDLFVNGNLTYADTSSLPFGGGVGIRFDGDGDFLVGESLNWPQQARSSTAYIDDTSNPLPGPCNYTGIVNRSFQLWVRPDASGLGNGLAQSVVVDSNQFGVLISADDTWVLRYAGNDFDTGAAVMDGWQHVQVSRPFGAGGAMGGARLWVDGRAVGALGGGDYSASRVDLVVGANTANDEGGNFTGGTAEFFTGELDRVLFSVHGDNSTDEGPPPGQDYGTFDFVRDNDFATAVLSGVTADLNGDGIFDSLDRAAFIDGWMTENLVNGLRAGDLDSYTGGDLNIDGITNIRDLALFQSELNAAGLATIASAELVPEPTAAWSVIVAMLSLLGIRHFRPVEAGRI